MNPKDDLVAIIKNLQDRLATLERGTAGAVAVSVTTKGDIQTYSTTPTRLPVGNNGQVLTANSTEVTGLKWADFNWGDIGGTLADQTDLQTALNGKSSTSHTHAGTYIAPSFLNSWVNYDTTYNDAGYFKDTVGVVHLRGLVKNGTIGTAIFTLPAGYRPIRRQLFTTSSNGALGRCDVEANGNVLANAGNNAWFSLDGLTFLAEQ